MKIRFLAAALAAGIVLTGCETTNQTNINEPSYQDAREDLFIPTNQAAAQQLIAQLGHNVQPPSRLMIATLVNVDNLDETSSLGRMISEQVSATFTRSGYRMHELNLSKETIASGGQLRLSREAQQLVLAQGAQAVVVGTYATSRDFVYVNLKVIHPGNSVVLAVHDYALPMNRNVRRMLAN